MPRTQPVFTTGTRRPGWRVKSWPCSGFTRSDAGSYSTALRSDKRNMIAVSSGDEGTGVAAASPSTKQGKGPRTIAAVSSNATQLELFPGEIMMPPPADDIDCLTWILLFRAAATELRSRVVAAGDDE